ncbi:MAG: class I SAM-dependent methyltransferase [Bacillota bacterium]
MYSVFSRYYEEIFPPGPAQLAFLREVARETKARSLLDAGCAAGGYARAAAGWGMDVTGIDLDPDMIREAQSRGPAAVKFMVADLTALPFAGGAFDMVICLGNTLAHLLDVHALDKALAGFRRVLSEGGALVFQLVNYHRVRAEPEFSFPVLTSASGNVTFQRRYYLGDDGLYDFVTSLQVGGESFESVFPLRPWRREDFELALQTAGFARWDFFGDFARHPYGPDSPALVVRAVA